MNSHAHATISKPCIANNGTGVFPSQTLKQFKISQIFEVRVFVYLRVPTADVREQAPGCVFAWRFRFERCNNDSETELSYVFVAKSAYMILWV